MKKKITFHLPLQNGWHPPYSLSPRCTRWLSNDAGRIINFERTSVSCTHLIMRFLFLISLSVLTFHHARSQMKIVSWPTPLCNTHRISYRACCCRYRLSTSISSFIFQCWSHKNLFFYPLHRPRLSTLPSICAPTCVHDMVDIHLCLFKSVCISIEATQQYRCAASFCVL